MDMDGDEEAQDAGGDEPIAAMVHCYRRLLPMGLLEVEARSSDSDTEEDPMGPDTHGQTPRTTFEVGKGGLLEVFDDKRRKEDDDDD